MIIFCGLSLYPLIADNASQTDQFEANTIKHNYEQGLFTLSPYKQTHFGLRMFRQTHDPKYQILVQEDIANISIKLNQFSSDMVSEETMSKYATQKLADYHQSNDERSTRRVNTIQDNPAYVYLGLDLLRYMARIDDYGLQHSNNAKFRQRLLHYPFAELFTNKIMVQAWAAQLANQAYWLKQLQLGDYVALFTQTLQHTYPDNEDHLLSAQQYQNKLYGMTHLIIADSNYYQKQVKEADHPWVFHYFRTHIDRIISDTKQDIIAEVGISFLLAGLQDDPVVYKTRQAIKQAINPQAKLVPSVTGSTDFSHGEHRNVLAIMLLDWHAPTLGPNTTTTPQLFESLPFGLQRKQN
ncbi:DUF3541 domain-containing protein [Vibrio rarus]|uniref:DUF3541 domain-containing protein n=1 Tax=Vibrio rarus TaxID=413403 RepID=UPI0021C2E1EE|nr:DUF3541 domain-containing protein [Vibrio rarus]